MTAITGTRPATPKQLAFIERLLAERDTSRIEQDRIDGRHDMGTAGASLLIEALLRQPKKTASDVDPSEVLTPGVYERNGEVFVVKKTRDGQRMYAKKLVEIDGRRITETDDVVQIDFQYAPGAVAALRPRDRMPVDRAKALTVRYGRCLNCGRVLKDAVSVERGIGPVCIKSFA